MLKDADKSKHFLAQIKKIYIQQKVSNNLEKHKLTLGGQKASVEKDENRRYQLKAKYMHK